MFPLLTLHYLLFMSFLILHNGKPQWPFLSVFPSFSLYLSLSLSVSLVLSLSLSSFPSCSLLALLLLGKSCVCFRIATGPKADFGTLHRLHNANNTMRHFLSPPHLFLSFCCHCYHSTLVVQGCCWAKTAKRSCSKCQFKKFVGSGRLAAIPLTHSHSLVSSNI